MADPHPGAVIVGARPAMLHRDARGDLHNPAGLALAYPDGWGFHAWHGRRVPGWVIDAPSTEAIMAEENVEVRRCKDWLPGVHARQLQRLARRGERDGTPG